MRARAVAAALAPIVLLLPGAQARADNLSLTASPNYGISSSRSTFADGTTTRNEASNFGHSYRLGLDRSFYPRLSFSAGGTFDQQIGWTAVPGPASRGDMFNWSGFGRLSFGDQVLGGGLGYDRGQEWSASRLAGRFSRTPTFAREGWAGSLRWAPADLPQISMNASRSDSYDVGRTLMNQRTDSAGLTTSYSPVENLDLAYSLSWSRPQDLKTGTVTNTIGNSARASYSGSYLGKRGSYSTSYGISNASSDTTAASGGAVITQQFPTAGLSGIETFPADVTSIRLDQNPDLINGDTRATPLTAVDLGFSASSPGDPRDVGVEMAFPYPAVSRILLWVDKPLPDAVVAPFKRSPPDGFSAWRSDDNFHWTPVPITSVEFGLMDNRFEITIEQTRSRYVKVVTRPLPVGVTTDALYRSILVTEIQVQDVAAVHGHLRTSSTSGDVMATTRISLLEGKGRPVVAFDSTARLGHSGSPVTWTYMLVNGLSHGQPLGTKARLSSRLERSDAGSDRGNHMASNRLSGALAYNPIPALSHNLGASTELRQTDAGNVVSAGTTLANRAQLIQTIGVSNSVAYARTWNPDGFQAQSAGVNGSLSLAPHSTTAGSVSYSYGWSESHGGGQPSSSSSGQTLSASLSWNPYPAVYFAGSMTRSWIDRPTTLLSFSAGFSPLRDGEVQLAFAYAESYESVSQRRSRTYGPSLRWNIRPGVYLEAGYGESRLYSPVVDSVSRSFSASLFVPVL